MPSYLPAYMPSSTIPPYEGGGGYGSSSRRSHSQQQQQGPWWSTTTARSARGLHSQRSSNYSPKQHIHDVRGGVNMKNTLGSASNEFYETIGGGVFPARSQFVTTMGTTSAYSLLHPLDKVEDYTPTVGGMGLFVVRSSYPAAAGGSGRFGGWSGGGGVNTEHRVSFRSTSGSKSSSHQIDIVKVLAAAEAIVGEEKAWGVAGLELRSANKDGHHHHHKKAYRVSSNKSAATATVHSYGSDYESQQQNITRTRPRTRREESDNEGDEDTEKIHSRQKKDQHLLSSLLLSPIDQAIRDIVVGPAFSDVRRESESLREGREGRPKEWRSSKQAARSAVTEMSRGATRAASRLSSSLSSPQSVSEPLSSSNTQKANAENRKRGVTNRRDSREGTHSDNNSGYAEREREEPINESEETCNNAHTDRDSNGDIKGKKNDNNERTCDSEGSSHPNASVGGEEREKGGSAVTEVEAGGAGRHGDAKEEHVNVDHIIREMALEWNAQKRNNKEEGTKRQKERNTAEKREGKRTMSKGRSRRVRRRREESSSSSHSSSSSSSPHSSSSSVDSSISTSASSSSSYEETTAERRKKRKSNGKGKERSSSSSRAKGRVRDRDSRGKRGGGAKEGRDDDQQYKGLLAELAVHVLRNERERDWRRFSSNHNEAEVGRREQQFENDYQKGEDYYLRDVETRGPRSSDVLGVLGPPSATFRSARMTRIPDGYAEGDYYDYGRDQQHQLHPLPFSQSASYPSSGPQHNHFINGAYSDNYTHYRHVVNHQHDQSPHSPPSGHPRRSNNKQQRMLHPQQSPTAVSTSLLVNVSSPTAMAISAALGTFRRVGGGGGGATHHYQHHEQHQQHTNNTNRQGVAAAVTFSHPPREVGGGSGGGHHSDPNTPMQRQQHNLDVLARNQKGDAAGGVWVDLHAEGSFSPPYHALSKSNTNSNIANNNKVGRPLPPLAPHSIGVANANDFPSHLMSSGGQQFSPPPPLPQRQIEDREKVHRREAQPPLLPSSYWSPPQPHRIPDQKDSSNRIDGGGDYYQHPYTSHNPQRSEALPFYASSPEMKHREAPDRHRERASHHQPTRPFDGRGEAYEERNQQRQSVAPPTAGNGSASSPSPPPPAPLLSRPRWSLADFDVGKRLGQGKFGKIYLAREKSTKCAVALKCISKDIVAKVDMANQVGREVAVHGLCSRSGFDRSNPFSSFSSLLVAADEKGDDGHVRNNDTAMMATNNTLLANVAAQFYSFSGIVDSRTWGGGEGEGGSGASAALPPPMVIVRPLCDPQRHVLKLLAYFWDDAAIFLVEEYCDGGDLNNYRLTRGTTTATGTAGEEPQQNATAQNVVLPEAEARTIVLQLAAALACLHRNGVIHRDVKPENVLLKTRRALRERGMSEQEQRQEQQQQQQHSGISSASRATSTAGAISASIQLLYTAGGGVENTNLNPQKDVSHTPFPVVGGGAFADLPFEVKLADFTWAVEVPSVSSMGTLGSKTINRIGPDHIGNNNTNLHSRLNQNDSSTAASAAFAGTTRTAAASSSSSRNFHNQFSSTAFSASSYLRVAPEDRRKTLCGTLDYLSPELVSQQSYDFCVDVWGLGVLTFELLFGVLPFAHESPRDTCLRISRGDYVFPTHTYDGRPIAVSEAAKDFIHRLLHVDSDARITCEEALRHPWLQGLSRLPPSYGGTMNPQALSGSINHLHRSSRHPTDTEDVLQRRRGSSVGVGGSASANVSASTVLSPYPSARHPPPEHEQHRYNGDNDPQHRIINASAAYYKPSSSSPNSYHQINPYDLSLVAPEGRARGQSQAHVGGYGHSYNDTFEVSALAKGEEEGADGSHFTGNVYDSQLQTQNTLSSINANSRGGTQTFVNANQTSRVLYSGVQTAATVTNNNEDTALLGPPDLSEIHATIHAAPFDDRNAGAGHANISKSIFSHSPADRIRMSTTPESGGGGGAEDTSSASATTQFNTNTNNQSYATDNSSSSALLFSGSGTVAFAATARGRGLAPHERGCPPPPLHRSETVAFLPNEKYTTASGANGEGLGDQPRRVSTAGGGAATTARSSSDFIPNATTRRTPPTTSLDSFSGLQSAHVSHILLNNATAEKGVLANSVVGNVTHSVPSSTTPPQHALTNSHFFQGIQSVVSVDTTGGSGGGGSSSMMAAARSAAVASFERADGNSRGEGEGGRASRVGSSGNSVAKNNTGGNINSVGAMGSAGHIYDDGQHTHSQHHQSQNFSSSLPSSAVHNTAANTNNASRSSTNVSNTDTASSRQALAFQGAAGVVGVSVGGAAVGVGTTYSSLSVLPSQHRVHVGSSSSARMDRPPHTTTITTTAASAAIQFPSSVGVGVAGGKAPISLPIVSGGEGSINGGGINSNSVNNYHVFIGTNNNTFKSDDATCLEDYVHQSVHRALDMSEITAASAAKSGGSSPSSGSSSERDQQKGSKSPHSRSSSFSSSASLPSSVEGSVPPSANLAAASAGNGSGGVGSQPNYNPRGSSLDSGDVDDVKNRDNTNTASIAGKATVSVSPVLASPSPSPSPSIFPIAAAVRSSTGPSPTAAAGVLSHPSESGSRSKSKSSSSRSASSSFSSSSSFMTSSPGSSFIISREH